MIAVMVAIVLVATQSTMVYMDAHTETDDQETATAIANNSYRFRIYALNQSMVQHKSTSTQFHFNTNDLPIGIDAVIFEDFRTDTSYQSTYYGCSGILMNASGANAEITLRESSGKFISTLEYHGQNPVVFGSMAWSTSGSAAKTFNGTDILVLDWRAGEWTPAQGIILEHPSNVTLMKAKFFVMVFAPGYDQEIPEFDLLVGPVLATMLILFIRKQRVSGAQEKDGAP